MRLAVLALFSFLTFIVGCGTPSFLVTPVSSSSKLQEHEVRSSKGWSPPKIALIEVEGMLMNAQSGGFLQATENKVSLFTQQMERAAADPKVKAVVLRINSPGGTVTASDTMYDIVRKFRERTGKPVVASTQEVAASGAYYIALGADQIVAHPTSVIGSIGVIFNALEFEGTLAKLGITAHAIKSGSLKDMGSPYKNLDASERAVMQEMVDEYFVRFQQLVRARRPSLDEPVLPSVEDYRDQEYAGVFSGRVFSGERSVQLGLADQTGGLDDALRLARQLSDSPGARVVMYKRPYGYSGSIYATGSVESPRADVLRVEIPGLQQLPAGFYYLWEPGR